VQNRTTLIPLIQAVTHTQTAEWWLASLEALNIPCAPINTLPQVFADPQVLHRGMAVRMRDDRYASGELALLGNPLKLSATPVRYVRTPPRLGEHTQEVLASINHTNEGDKSCSN
jgi:crotonobetainyl-CoA:carnitine CoA-transferase CaiB-like acyl-CoA transferase